MKRLALDERAWVVSAGLGPQWRAVARRREDAALRRLAAASRGAARAPEGLDLGDARDSFRVLLAREDAARRRLLSHPALDYWLHLWESRFGLPIGRADWRLHQSQLRGFAAHLAWSRRARARLRAALDPAGRFHLHGGPLSFDFGSASADRGVTVTVEPGRLRAELDDGRALSAPREALAAPDGARLTDAAGAIRVAPQAAPGLFVEHGCWLLDHAVVMHGLAAPSVEEERRFAAVLGRAFAETRALEPELADEIIDMTRVLIPLQPSKEMASVSSSYTTMRGAICLSHSDETALQVETLIHEFCHQKVNLLTETDPLIEPGQGGQVYYSPWRKDARRLRGLLLGAHAFLNVARHLLRRVVADSWRDPAQVDLMRGVALRAFQVDSALRTLDLHADFTPLGARFAALAKRELGGVFAGGQCFPAGLWKEARKSAADHAEAWQLGETGLHRPEGWKDPAKRAPFLDAGPEAA